MRSKHAGSCGLISAKALHVPVSSGHLGFGEHEGLAWQISLFGPWDLKNLLRESNRPEHINRLGIAPDKENPPSPCCVSTVFGNPTSP
ncbi:MAG TPA: hypothetical protein VNX28_13605, partial [Gemmataceae bacterium]|nr:hypothetical protein [Gemmataceae bacterium]